VSDELENRLRRANPVASDATVHPADGTGAAILRRTIMSTDDEMLTGLRSGAEPPLWRRPVVLGVVGAAAAAAVVITVVAVTSDDAVVPTAATTVTYDLGGSGAVMSSCVPFADLEPMAGAAALTGTVVSIDGDLVVLDVDRWYAGGDADQVLLRGTPDTVSLDGVEFVVGEDYLVTAADGVVQPCGMSGPASPELEQAYDQWYG